MRGHEQERPNAGNARRGDVTTRTKPAAAAVIAGHERADELAEALAAFRAAPFEGEVWRVVRRGRDPARGSVSRSRWCDGSFGVLYTSSECDGAIADLSRHADRRRFSAFRLQMAVGRVLRIADRETLAGLGVDVARYAGRDYGRTQAIASAAHRLGVGGLIVPSAHWACQNLVVFTDRIATERIGVVTGPEPVDIKQWRAQVGASGRQSSASSMAYMSSSDRPK